MVIMEPNQEWIKLHCQQVLIKYTNTTLEEVKAKYNEKGRFYHNFEHIQYMLRQGYILENYMFFTSDEMLLAILFHDYILDDVNGSIVAFSGFVKEEYKYHKTILGAYRLIEATDKHEPNEHPASEFIIRLDLAILREPFPLLMEYEHKIFKEYQKYDYTLYKEGRIMVLESLEKKHCVDLSQLKSYVTSRVPHIGLFAGSFNPFHAGHYNILEKSEKVFDKVIIARGNNYDKNHKELLPMPKIVSDRQYIEYNSLLKDVVQSLGYPVTVIRGVRNGKDIEEDLIAYKKFSLKEINFVYIISDSQFEQVSSSGIRKNLLLDF
jgi:pantetheine-phosphate adenylyltransferase